MRSTLLKSRFQVAGGECARLCSRLRRHLCVLAMGDGSAVSREEDYFYTAQVHTPYSHDNCPQPKE